MREEKRPLFAIKAAVYMYIGGLKNGSFHACSMTNWQTSKYFSIDALHNHAAKNSLWRSSFALTLHTNDNSSGDRKEEEAEFTPSFKKTDGRNGKIGSNGRKGFSDAKHSLNLKMMVPPLRALLS